MTDYLNPLANETAKAYAAFCLYRDMGAGRSIDAAYLRATSKVGQRASKVWVDWSSKYNWVERAKLYDAYLGNKAREQAEGEHLAELQEYRKQLAFSSKSALAAGQRALRLALEKLHNMDYDDIPATSIPSYIKAANDTIEKAMDGWGMALTVDELLEALENDGNI